MDITRYLKLILKRFWIILILELVAVVATFYYTQSQPRHYTAQTTIILNPQVPNSLVPYATSDYNYSLASNLADDYNQVLKSDKFAKRVMSQITLTIGIDELKGSYTSKLIPNTVFYNISATSNTPEKAQVIANTVTQVFLAEGVNETTTVDPSVSVLNQTMDLQRQELQNLQAEINSLKTQIAALNSITPTPVPTVDPLSSTTPTAAPANTGPTLDSLRQQLKDDLSIQSQIVVSLSDAESKSTAANRDSASLIDDAVLPTAPDDISLFRNILFAVIMAFALGIGVIVLLDFLDYTVRSSQELAQLTSTTTLGVVPVVKALPPPAAPTAAADSSAINTNLTNLNRFVVTAAEFKSAGSESYRALRTNILFCDINTAKDEEQEATQKLLDRIIEDEELSSMKTLLITSAIPGEGKSLTAANLAVTFAQAGNRVILVDGDLRQPTMHRLFGVPNERGFSNLVLAGPEHLREYLKDSGVPNLSLITAGNPPPNPSELLTSLKAVKVLSSIRRAADFIIIDSPPIVLVSDAAILSNRVDSVLLVVRSGSTRRDAITKAVTALRKVGAPVIGSVLNRVQQQDDGGYYYYEYNGYLETPKGGRRSKPKKDKTTSSSPQLPIPVTLAPSPAPAPTPVQETDKDTSEAMG